MACECETGFFGVSCQNALCKANTTCSGHGTCKKSSGVWNKLCDCDSGYTGDFCETSTPAAANAASSGNNKNKAAPALVAKDVTVDPDELDDFVDVVR